MVHPYLRRKQGLEPEDYPKEELRPVLGRTLGVPIFQEQVMKLAMVAAGYTAEQADQLRRAMAAWRCSGHLEKYQTDLMEKMLARGLRTRLRGTRVQADRGLRRVRFSGEPFGELRAARLHISA